MKICNDCVLESYETVKKFDNYIKLAENWDILKFNRAFAVRTTLFVNIYIWYVCFYTLEDIFMVDNFMVDNLMVAKIWGFSRKIPKF